MSPVPPDSPLRPIARAVRRAARLAVQAAENRAAMRGLERHRLATQEPPSTMRLQPRIAVDGCVFTESREGIARVWESVLTEWSRSDFASHVTILDRAGSAPRLPGFAYREMPRVRERFAASQRALVQAACDAERAALFVSTLYTTPLTTPSAQLLYDFTPEVLGWDLSTPMWRERVSAISYASAFACISRSTARDLKRLYRAQAARPTSVIHLAADDSFVPATPAEVATLRGELGLPDRYYLFMGLRDAHKNAALVFQALARWSGAADFAVLFVGGSPEPEAALQARAGSVPVRVARRLSDAELRAAYTGALALLYPSLYEGFGLPVLEAQGCECPVICSDRASLPEVAGDGALFVDPTDSDALAQAMRAVTEAATRAALIDRGLANRSRFRWTATAGALADALLAQARPDAAGR